MLFDLLSLMHETLNGYCIIADTVFPDPAPEGKIKHHRRLDALDIRTIRLKHYISSTSMKNWFLPDKLLGEAYDVFKDRLGNYYGIVLSADYFRLPVSVCALLYCYCRSLK